MKFKPAFFWKFEKKENGCPRIPDGNGSYGRIYGKIYRDHVNFFVAKHNPF
jgi:hypothetical protein